MIKIKALNDSLDGSASSDGDYQVTREVEEEELNKLYTDALKHASSGETEKAIELLEKLKAELEDENPKIKEASLLAKLRYLTHKNLGIIKNDIDHLLDALNIDDTDITMWLRVGTKSKQQLNYLLAKYCYEAAFNIQRTNLIAIDNLCEIYFVLDDLYSCSSVCLHALDIMPDLLKPKVILNECIRLMPPLLKELDDHLHHILVQFGGHDDTLEDCEYVWEQILEPLTMIKRKRHHLDDERETEKENAKRRKLTLDLTKGDKLTFADVGLKIKKLYEQIQAHHYLFTPVEVIFRTEPLPMTIPIAPVPTVQEEAKDEPMIIESVSAGNSQSNPAMIANENSKSVSQSMDVVKEDEASKPPKFNRHDYALDYDKRRSTRMRGGGGRSAKSKELDDDTVLELLIDSLPDSMKNKVMMKNDFSDKDAGNSNSSSMPGEEAKEVPNKTSEATLAMVEFLNKLEAKAKEVETFKILELVEFYLIEISQTTQISIPTVFNTLYQYYREQFELPCGLLCEIGNEISLEMIYMILVASENNYNLNEMIFVAQMLGKVGEVLDEEHYRQFVVRYLTITGSKEFRNDNLHFALDLCSSHPKHANVFGLKLCPSDEVMEVDEAEVKDKNAEDDEVITTNSYQVMASNKLIINEAYIQTLLDIQRFSAKAAKDRDYTEVIQLFFTKSETEMTGEEKDQLYEAIVKAEMWQKGIELIEKWNELDSKCLFTILECVLTGQRARCSSKLVYKIAKKASAGYSVVPWLILYWVHIAEGVNTEDPKNKLIQFFKIGHHVLGKRGMCTQRDGEFLLLAYGMFTLHDVEEEAMQCSTCLFNFPARKNQSPSVMHTSPHIEMKWTHCQVIYDYFAPEKMPEFDSIGKQFQLLSETRDFLLRINKLVPESDRPNTKKVRDYINNGDALGVQVEVNEDDDKVINTIYYILADSYFKAKDFEQAEWYYLLDLSVNPNRFDAWAGLSLSYNYELSTLIDSEGPYTQRYHQAAFRVVQCFEAALRLQPENCKLWIEFGFVAYSIASNLSRAAIRKVKFAKDFKTDESKFEREQMLDKAQQCFETAKNLENDEPWLPFYMLGKVAEKRKGGDIFEILKYYEYADLCIHVDGAAYPKKIPYYNPPHLAVEALEVHYRLHVVIFKFLVNNRKFTARVLRLLYYKLVSYLRSPFVVRRAPAGTTAANIKKTALKNYAELNVPASMRDEQDLLELVDDLASNISERDTRPFDLVPYRDKLLKLCLQAMRRCISRYSMHYKSFYQLASYYYTKKDEVIAKAILLGDANGNKGVAELQLEDAEVGKKIMPSYLQGLFAEQRPNNLHQGIWRVQIEEIERSGTFNAHMFKSTLLLINVCDSSGDYQQLCQIAHSLSKTPELEKKFLNEQERVILCRLAYDKCFELLRKLWAAYPKHQMLALVDGVIQNFLKNNMFPETTAEHLEWFRNDLLTDQFALVAGAQQQQQQLRH